MGQRELYESEACGFGSDADGVGLDFHRDFVVGPVAQYSGEAGGGYRGKVAWHNLRRHSVVGGDEANIHAGGIARFGIGV